MEEQWYADRVRLRQLLREHGKAWGNARYAEEIGRSLSWVSEWKKRFREAPPDDESVLHSRSRRPRRVRARIHADVVTRILELRDELPAKLGRVAGPLTLIHYLHEDETMLASGHHLPTSTSTIHEILKQHDRLASPERPAHHPWPEREPLRFWQLDFKDVTTVPADPEGKKQHVVECLNVIDEGSSYLMGAVVRDDFTMATAIEALAPLLRLRGVPEQITFDRDPRFVGSWSGQTFPTPFVRFWLTLGVKVNLCPPQRPDRNAFVERYHRSYDQECLRLHWPTTLATAQAATERYVKFYNHERPNQARSCGNQPPSWALGARHDWSDLPLLPAVVDPNGWLLAIHGRAYTRRLTPKGSFQLDRHRYYVTKALAGKRVAVVMDAHAQELVVQHRQEVVRRLPLKGLVPHQVMTWQDYLDLLIEQVHSHWRAYLYHQYRRRAAG